MQSAERLPLASPTSLLAFALLAVVCLTLSLVPLRTSHDEWWHLKTGKWIEENGLPENDIFTYTAEDMAWHNHEWLSQLIFWRVYKAGSPGAIGGVRAVIFLKAAVVTLTFLGLGLFLARRTGAPALSALAAALGCALSRRTLYPRPPFISYALLALTLCVLIAWRARRFSSRSADAADSAVLAKSAWLFALVPLFALWANLHGGFLTGIVVLGAFWLEAGADWALAIWRKESTHESKSRWIVLSLLSGLCTLATLATPYGYHLYELPLRVMGDQRLAGVIGELLPPAWSFVWVVDACIVLMLFAAVRPRSVKGLLGTAMGAVLTVALMRGPGWIAGSEGSGAGLAGWELWSRETFALFIFLIAAARSKVSVGLAQTLLLIFFTHQGLQHVRFLPFMGVVLAPVMAFALSDWIKGSVGGWDWAWRARRVEWLDPEKLEALRRRLMQLAQLMSAGLLAMMAAFYLFLPEEAKVLLDRSADRPRLQSFLDRNLLLLRGQSADMNAWNEPWTEAGAYPKAAVDFLMANNLPGRLWNGGNYAGYLIWRLSPEKYKVFTDNRYDIYGGQFLTEEKIVLNAFEGDAGKGLPDWGSVLRRWEVGTLFIPVDQPIEAVLEQQSASPGAEWSMQWNDRLFAIWTRSSQSARDQPGSR